jgi:hypothetical protein
MMNRRALFGASVGVGAAAMGLAAAAEPVVAKRVRSDSVLPPPNAAPQRMSRPASISAKDYRLIVHENDPWAPVALSAARVWTPELENAYNEFIVDSWDDVIFQARDRLLHMPVPPYNEFIGHGAWAGDNFFEEFMVRLGYFDPKGSPGKEPSDKEYRKRTVNPYWFTSAGMEVGDKLRRQNDEYPGVTPEAKAALSKLYPRHKVIWSVEYLKQLRTDVRTLHRYGLTIDMYNDRVYDGTVEFVLSDYGARAARALKWAQLEA